MKILKYGEGYPKTITCNKCKSELEYVSDDVRDTSTTITSSVPGVKYITYDFKVLECPVCGHSVILNSHCKDIYYDIKVEPPQLETQNKTKKKRWWQI